MDTIYAIASGAIKSGVTVIRISGPKTLTIIEKMTGITDIVARHAYFNKIKHPTRPDAIDYGLTLYFKGPASFTGEDTVEFHIHGSLAVMNDMITALSTFEECRLAEPGEFSKRAFENGKMDLTQAEGLADLIDAETSMQKKQAMRQMEGALKNQYESWRTEIIDIMSRVEAYIDFPDEDIPSDIANSFNDRVGKLKEAFFVHINDNGVGEKLRTGIYTVLLGAPNAGKSSLMNVLAKREVSIVSNQMGTTRDAIELHLELNGYPVILTDTAGIRETSQSIEAIGIERAQQKAHQADIKLILIDSQNIQSSFNEVEPYIDHDSIIIINKCDLPFDRSALNNVIKQPTIEISTTETTGIDVLTNHIADKVKDKLSFAEPPLITNQRHRFFLNEAAEALSLFTTDKPIELAGEDLRIAAHALGKITGKIEVEDILDALFSNFCVGK